MTDKNLSFEVVKKQIKETFEKIIFFKALFVLLEIGLLFSLFKNNQELALAILSALVIILVTLFMHLWEAINIERLNDNYYDR